MSDGESGEGQKVNPRGLLGRLKQVEEKNRADVIESYRKRAEEAANAAKWGFRRTQLPSEQLGKEPIVIKRK